MIIGNLDPFGPSLKEKEKKVPASEEEQEQPKAKNNPVVDLPSQSEEAFILVRC